MLPDLNKNRVSSNTHGKSTDVHTSSKFFEGLKILSCLWCNHSFCHTGHDTCKLCTKAAASLSLRDKPLPVIAPLAFEVFRVVSMGRYGGFRSWDTWKRCSQERRYSNSVAASLCVCASPAPRQVHRKIDSDATTITQRASSCIFIYIASIP